MPSNALGGMLPCPNASITYHRYLHDYKTKNVPGIPIYAFTNGTFSLSLTFSMLVGDMAYDGITRSFVNTPSGP